VALGSDLYNNGRGYLQALGFSAANPPMYPSNNRRRKEKNGLRRLWLEIIRTAMHFLFSPAEFWVQLQQSLIKQQIKRGMKSGFSTLFSP